MDHGRAETVLPGRMVLRSEFLYCSRSETTLRDVVRSGEETPVRLTFEAWEADNCSFWTHDEIAIARRAWQACESALTSERDEARAALETKRKSYEAMSASEFEIRQQVVKLQDQLALAEAAIAGAYREAAEIVYDCDACCSESEYKIRALPPPAAIRAEKLLVAQAVKDKVRHIHDQCCTNIDHVCVYEGRPLSWLCSELFSATTALEEIKKETP